MLLRTYQADTLEQALALVRAELGDEATILSSRRVRAGLMAPSKLEITATLPAASEMTRKLARRAPSTTAASSEASSPGLSAPRAAPPPTKPAVDPSYVSRAMMPLRKDLLRLREELARLVETISCQPKTTVDARQIEAALRQVLRLPDGADGAAPHDLTSALVGRLQRAGTSARGAEEIASEVAQRLGESTSDAPLEHLAAAVVQRRLRCAAPVCERHEVTRVAVVGPAGVGKTTTLAKIAARAALVHQRSVAVVGFDNERIGAAESVKALAQTIGLPYRQAHSETQLGHALAMFSEKNLVLIDTTGYSPRRQRELGALGEVLARTGSEAHLVLSTELREMELDSAVNAFSLVKPKTLTVSKIDQTIGLGAIYDAATRSELPLMYLCNGRRVPEDIEAATASKAASLILGLQFN